MSEFRINSPIIARRAVVGLVALLLLSLCGLLRAQQTPVPTTRPLLEALNHETQSLFAQVAPSIVRVQLPMPTNLTLAPDDPLAKWATKLNPQEFRELLEIQHRLPGAQYTAEIRPTTAPSEPVPQTQPSHFILLQIQRFTPNSIGVVLDDSNRVLVPRFVDREACRYPIPVLTGDGRWATAIFLASDAQSNLTLLQLTTAIRTKPATLAPNKPDAGTLLLVMSLNPAANRLTVWEGWEPDVATIINIDGSIAGFTEAGRYLSAAACMPLVADLMHDGVVHRAFLGVVVGPVGPEDPDRQMYPTLGTTPALRIQQVIPGTVAQHAGLSEGDLILSLAGQSVGDGPSFAAAIANRRGNTAMQILRLGQIHLVNVELTPQ
jgi:S1-C subfamily serine protease